MDRVLAGLHWETCLFYLDDIIVFAATWEEHLSRLRQVFERLRHAKLKLGAEKCTFTAKEVSYLGQKKASYPIPRYLPPSERSTLPKTSQKSALSWVLPSITVGESKILQPSPAHCTP